MPFALFLHGPLLGFSYGLLEGVGLGTGKVVVVL